MLINLNGNLIDTEKIQSISEVIAPNNYPFDDSEGSHDDSNEWCYRFYISFIGKGKGMCILSTKYPGHESKEERNDVASAREALIKYWKPNQSTIPRINS